MTYQKENDKLVESFLQRTYFEAWRDKSDSRLENFQRLEIYLSPKCNLACKYCYHTNFGEEIYPKHLINSKRLMRNLELLLDWLIENDMAPDIDYFSGEPFVQNIGFDALDMILDKFSEAKKKPRFIVVPTNYTWMLSKRRTRQVENVIAKGKELKMPVILSASFDGKYCEANRPFVGRQKKRNDAYYEKCFAFNAEHKFGFHPMVYSERIEKWIDNFLWFQDGFKRHGIAPDRIYLLEVRNAEWSDKQIKDYMAFVEFLIDYSFKTLCGQDINRFLKFLFRARGFNILSNSLTSVGRGLGCSHQSCVYVRIGDLAIVPCHRTADSAHILAKFVTGGDGRISGIKAENPELLIGSRSFEFRTQPMCEACVIKHLCQGQCLGAAREVTGDLFSPIPTVCKMFHGKIAAMIKTFKRLNIFDLMLRTVNEDKRVALTTVERLM